MGKTYHYTTYLKHCIGSPISEQHYNTSIRDGYSTDEIIRRKINKKYLYGIYLQWCHNSDLIPQSLYVFRRIEDKVYLSGHKEMGKTEINLQDEFYIKSIKRKEVKRKSYINQNMILFYKNYFKRNANR